jgi:glycosyltransferase involved in cell wall biosynthesis
MPRAAMVLPPREGFAPGRAGAIGLILDMLARGGSRFESLVLGPPQPAIFAGTAYCAVADSWWPGPRALRYARGVARALRPLRPAIVEVHNRPALALPPARHLDAPVTRILPNRRAGRQRGGRAAMRRHLHLATGSDWLRRDTIDGMEGAAIGANIAVLPNPIDLDALPAPIPGERAPTILFAGRIVADKGADAFVAACSLALPRLPGWHATMIGADRFGPDSPETPYLTRLRAQAAAAGIAMEGYRPHGAVLAAMAAAAIVAVPSRWPEPFGMVALEAMACGVVPVATNVGGLPEAVIHGETGYLEGVGDIDGQAARVTALLTDPDLRQRLAHAARQRASDVFCSTRIIPRYEQLFEEVVG